MQKIKEGDDKNGQAKASERNNVKISPERLTVETITVRYC